MLKLLTKLPIDFVKKLMFRKHFIQKVLVWKTKKVNIFCRNNVSYSFKSMLIADRMVSTNFANIRIIHKYPSIPWHWIKFIWALRCLIYVFQTFYSLNFGSACDPGFIPFISNICFDFIYLTKTEKVSILNQSDIFLV